MSSEFTTSMAEGKASYSAHGYDWEIEAFKIKENGSYKIFISTPDGTKGNALFIVENTTIQNAQALIEIAKKDIDENEDNKYGLDI